MHELRAGFYTFENLKQAKIFMSREIMCFQNDLQKMNKFYKSRDKEKLKEFEISGFLLCKSNREF